ncbi:hypothetical protein ACIRF8_25065 [Streptomyces sp. NPDC102406]|uniref:hypothetical protein n=1 Tax=Streptomyces sp. NPDC102406 TaxID=3366171 RepID=UPI0038248D94
MPAAPPLPKVPHGFEQGRRAPSRLRLSGLLTAVVLAAALPLTGASAGPVGDADARRSEPRTGSGPEAEPRTESGSGATADEAGITTEGDASDGSANGRGDGVANGGADSPQCGPQLTSPEGIEAQTCVLRRGRSTWARTYYRNTTGGGLSAVLTLMAPGGRTVRITCAVGAEDEPGLCETPRGRTLGEPAEYAAVAEYATDDDGPLLLRSGSNSAPAYGR